MAKFSFGSGEFGGGGSFGSGGSFSGKSGNGERRSPSIVAESLDEERLKPYLEGYQEYLSTNPDDEEGAQLAGEDKLFTWENEHQSMLPLAGKVIQTGLKGVGINLPNIFEDYKGIPELGLGTGNTTLNMDLESLSPEDQKKYIDGYTNYRNRHPDAKEDDLNAHLAGQSAVRSGWYENRWNKEPEGSKEQKLPEFWMPGGATRFEDLAPEIIEQLKNPQEQSKESPFQFGEEQTEVTDEKVRSTLEKIQGQLSELGGNGTVQETYAMQADANALSDYLNGITDDQDSVRPILDKWNIGNYQNALGQNQQQEEQQSAFTFSAEQTEVTDDAVRGTLSKIQGRLAELGGNGSAQETYAMQADANALNDYLNGITDDPESVRPILEKWKAGNNLTELGKPEPNIWQKALTEKTMQDMRLALGLLTGEDNIDLSQMNTPALDALAGTATSAHEAIVKARDAFFASFQEGLLSAEESAAWLGFNLSNLLRLDGPVRAVNEWMISNALGHNVDLSGFNLLSEGFEGWAGAAQNKQQLLQADSDALKEAARPEMESVFKQFMSEQDAKTWTETILTDLVQGTGQTFGSMYPGMISMYTSAAGMLGGAEEASGFIGRIWDALRQPGSWSVFINEAGQATKEARQRYGEGITDWDLGMAMVTGMVNTAIENYETKLGRGIQSIIASGSFPGLASLITSGFTEMLEEGKQKFTGDLNQDIADLASGRSLTHKLSFTEEEALFNVADYLDLCASTYVTSVGLGVAMGGANLAGKPFRTAVENVLNGTATPEEARMAAEAAEMAMADQEAQRQAGTVETPTPEEQHNTFKNTANGNEKRPAPGGTDARAEAAVEEAGADAWDEEQDYKREQFVLEELERAGAPQEQIDAQRALVNEKLEAWNRAKAAPAEAREEAPAPPAPIVPGELEFERARQEFLEERDKMLELERMEAPQEELDAQQAILDQKKAAMDQLNPFSYTPPAREESNLPPAETSYTPPEREENNMPPAETDVQTAEQRMREAQAAEVQAIIASNDPNVPAEERAQRAQEASDASARRAAAEEEYRRAQAAADAAVKNQNDQADLRSQEEQRAQQAQDEARKAELRLKRAQEARQQAEEAAKQQGLQARERAEAEKKAGIARRQERRAQEAYNKALKAADEQNRQADARKAADDAAQNSIDQMVGILQEDDQTNVYAQDVAPDQNRQAAERLRLEEEARAAEQRMQEARAEETQAIIASNDPDVPPEERARREQEARDAMGRREEAENEYREAQAAVDALESTFVPTEEPAKPEDLEGKLVDQEEPAKPEDQESKLVDQEEPEQPESKLVPQDKSEDQVSNLVNQEPPAKPDDQVGNLVPQEKPEEQKSDLVPMDEPAKQDDQVGTLVEDEAGEAGDGEGNAEEPKAEEPLSTLVEDEEEEAGEGEGSTGEEQPANEEENEAGENEGNTGETLSPEDQQLVDNANKHNDSLGFSHYDGTNWKPGVTIKTAPATLSQGQRSELSVFDSYAKKKGYTLVVHDQLFNEDGESVNGFYRPDEDSGRVIHVALDSENPLRSTMGHELYHMLKELNPEGAKRVAKEFARWANKAGVDINSLVRSKVELYYGQGYIKDKTDRRAWDYAYEEVVCDSLLDVIGDQQTVQALAIGDRNLVQRMRDWISKTMQQIHQMLSEYALGSDEARILTEQEGALEKIREVFDKALDETNALQESKKAGKSLGSNSKMMDTYIKGLDAATTYSEANAEATKLAAAVLKTQGLETSSKNINDVISMAQMMEAGYMLSEAAKELGIDIKSTPETERAVRALGRYVTSLLQQDKIEELEALYGVGTSSDEVISQEAEEEGEENTETKQKQSDDTKRSEPDRAIETVSKREGKNADMIGRVSDEAKDSKGGKLYSLKSMRNDIPEYRKMLKDSKVFSDNEINGLFDTITEAMKTIEKYASILDLNERGGRNDRAFSPVKPNSDALYKVSLDFSTLCRKRLLQQTIQEAIEKKYSVTMSKAERVALTNALKKVQAEGAKIEVACALCYVESARLKSPEQIRRFMADKRKYIIDYLSKNDKNYKDAIQQAADAKAKELGYEEGYSLKNMSKKDADAILAVKRRMYAEYKPTAEQEAMIRKAETMDESMYKTAAGLAELKKNYPMVFDAYTTMVRNATKSKGLESDVPFYARDTFDTISDALITAMNAENGLRSQSWSDFQVTHLLDYIGAIIELSTRGAKMQAYTKVPEYARLMGLTGQMINLSLIPTDYDGEHLGYDPKEGMDFETAQRLRNEFPDTVGSICIGIRDDHIRALLINDLIDYVIPYHKSSMDKATRNKIGLKNWSEYESQQNEKNRDYDTTVYDGYYHKHLNFSDWYNYQEAKALAENYKKQGMRAFEASKAAMEDMARKYVEICHSRGLQEKFANFSSDKGYWKLLIDRKMINQVTGELIEQKAVRPVFDNQVIQDILKSEVARVHETQPDMDRAVNEMLNMWENGDIQKAAKSKDVKTAVKAMEENFAKAYILESSSALDQVGGPGKASVKKNQDKETSDKAADEKRLLEVETDIAGNDMQVWDLLKVMREMKRGQDAEGNAKGYWKKDVPKIVKTLEEEINSVGRTKEITKLVTEYFEDLDAFEGTTAAFMDYALQQGQALVTDLYRGEHRAYNQAMMQDYEGGKNAIRDFFRGGYWYISPAMKDYINTYIDSYRGFRRVMNAAGIRVTTVEGEKKSGHSVDLESAWKPRDPRTGRSDSNGLYEMLGGEETDSLGDIVQKVYDAITRESADEDVSLTMEEYDLTGKVGLTLVADYLQAGAMKEGARVSEEARGQKPPTEMDRLREETSAQRGVLQQKSDEIEQLNKEIDKLNNALSKEIGRSSKLAMQLKEMKKNGAAADKLAQAKAELATANKEKQKAVNALEKAREKLDAQKDELNELRKQLRKTERAYDNALSQMDDLKERRAEQMENMKNRLIEKYKKEAREKIAQAKARQKATKKRRQLVAGIRNTGAKLKNYMAHPSATKGYIPQQNAERAAELIEIMMANDGRKSAAKAGRRLMDSIRDAKESPDYFVSTMYDDELNRAMQEVAKILEDKQSLYNLDDAELEIVHKTLKAINHQIQNADKTIGRQKNAQLASEAADGVLLMQRNRESMKGVGRMIRKGVLTHLNPQRFFAIWGHHGDNAITRMGEEASEGQRKKNKLTMDMTKVFEGLTQGENEKKFDKFTGKNATWYDTGIHILDERGNDTGRTWKITEAMRTFFALSWQADENKEGMRAGVKMNGHEMYQLTIPDEELMKKGKEKEAYARGERVYFTEADANAIIGELTDYEKQWMTAWRDMEKISKQAINETSLLLNGFRKANVGNYVPIFRDPRYIGKEFETVVTDSRLTSMGFLKERVNSHLPMMLMDLKNVINRQVRDVSDYYGFAIPARNLTKIYNANFGGTSFKEVLNKTQGMEVGQYFEKLMADLQGSSRVESSPLDKLRGNVAGAVLSGNPSVIIKQAASYPAAASVLGWKPLLKGLKYFNPAGLKGINVDKIDQYTSALWERRSRSLSDLEANANRNTRMSKTLHWLTNGIQGMDVATTKVIWKAAEYYVDEHNPDLSRGTDEYNRAVARIYEQALEGTQPEYGTMQRPGILRSQSQIVKSLTMYKTQSLQNFNILVDAATNLSDKAKAAKANNSEENQAALKTAKRQMATALSSQITSAVILGVMTAVGKALLHKLGGYRDDKGDLTAESVGGQIMKDSASSVAGMVAGGSELFDLIAGLIEGQSPFDIEAAGVSTINDLYQNTYAFLDAMKVIGDGDLTDAQKLSQMWPKVRKLGLSVTQLLGLPVGNFANLIDGIAANAADFATGKPGSFASGSPLQIAGTPIIGSAQGRETSNKSVAGYIAQAMMDGDQTEAMRLYNEQIRQGKSVDALNSAIATWQKANIPEIRQAAEAIDNGDLNLYNQLINELTGKGLSMTNAVKYVEAERKKLGVRSEELGVNGPETAQALTYQEIVTGMTKETKTSEDNSYTNGMMNSLLEDGNVQAAMAVRDDMLANGKTKSSISSSLSSFWKPRLQEAYQNGDMVTVRQITQMLVQMGLKHTTIQGWTSSTGTSSSSSSKKSGFGSGSFGSGSFGSSKKSSSKKSGFGSGSFGGKGFGK